MVSTIDITNATRSDLSAYDEYSVDAMNTEGATDQEETEYVNTKWSQNWGYFNSIAEAKSAIIMKATWNVGKGYNCDTETSVILDHISGWGKESFNDILFNMEVTKRIGGDAFCEIIRDEETGELINLKPLDPGSIKIIVNREGIIKRYEQINKTGNKGVVVNKFNPKDILHFSNNRLADQIHGISDFDAIEKIILADGESFDDIKKVMHRQAKPFIIFKLKTDNKTKIDAIVSKVDELRNKGEDLFIPDDEDILSYEVVQVNISPEILSWRDELRKKFYRAIGLPELIPSGGGEATESGGKIGSLHFGQIVEKDQREIERAIWNQLQLRIDLLPPETIANTLAQDISKDGSNQQMGFQANDMMAGVGK